MTRLKPFGPLESVHIEGFDDGLYIVIFHGYGADCHDLASLGQVIEAPLGSHWVFPNAPIQIPIGPGFFGRAWFNIDIQAYERALRTGTHRDLAKLRPPGLDQAKAQALEMVRALNV